MEQTTGQTVEHNHKSRGIDESELMARLHKGYVSLKHQIHKVIVGQDDVTGKDDDGACDSRCDEADV